MAKRDFGISAITNAMTYDDYLYRVKKIANARFEWVNLPETWDPDFLENVLYYHGECGVFWSGDIGPFVSRITMRGGINEYDLPTQIESYSHANTPKRVTAYVYDGIGTIDDLHNKNMAVLVKNNPDRRSTYSTVQLFCRRLYEIERTLDVNLNLQKTPGMVVCDPKQRLTLLNLYMQYDGNQPFIFGDKNLLGETNLIKVIDTEAPFLVDKLQAHKQSVWSELLSFLGINNVNYEKKERLIQDEANANNHFTSLNKMPEYRCRKRACQQINKYFGLNIDVKFDDTLFDKVKNVNNIDENVESGEQ